MSKMTLDTLPDVENGTLEKVKRNDQDINPPYESHDTVLPKCYNGYEFKGTKAILLPNADKSGLVWIPSTLTCKPKQIEKLPKVENGTLTRHRTLEKNEYLSSASMALNDYVNLNCIPGYTSKQWSSILTVDKNNHLVWEPAVLSCEPMILNTEPTLVGGHYSFSKKPPYIVGDRAEIHCDPGYESSLQHAVVIPRAGKLVWNPEKLYCQPMRLDTLPIVKNGEAFLRNVAQPPFYVGTRVTITCDPEHRTADTESEIVIDSRTGKLKWQPDNIRCKRINCPEPPATGSTNLKKSGSGRNLLDRIEYSCPPNFQVMGRFNKASRFEPILNPSYWCNPEGEWMPKLPEELHCTGFLCPELKKPNNAYLKQAPVKDGPAIYTCVKDSKVFTRTCQADGTWSGKEPKCPSIHSSFNFSWILLLVLLISMTVLFIMK